MKRLTSITFIAMALMVTFLISCVNSEEAFKKQLDEDAKTFTEMKCELMKQLKTIKADTTITNQQHLADSLKAIWKEKAGPLQEKYDTPDHKDMFKEKVKEYQDQIEGCEMEK